MAAPRMNHVPPAQRQHHHQQHGIQHHTGGFFNSFFGGAHQDTRAQAAAMEEQRRREQEQARRERGPPPASRRALKNIPDVKIAAHDLMEETNRSCSVCLDDHELGGKAVKLPCAHIFHRECVWEWLELHCTCPVCRFELETEDNNYEKERRVRMQGRRPRYRRRELDDLSIPQIRNLARGQNVNIIGCLEKADIVTRIVDSGTVEVIEGAARPEYEATELSEMSARQLRALMLQLGIDVQGCLEKADLLERVLSSRLVTVTHNSPPPPPPPPPYSSATVGRTGVDTTAAGAGAGDGHRFSDEQSSSTGATARRSWWGWPGGRGSNEDSVPSPAGEPPTATPTTASTTAPPTASPALDVMSVKDLRAIMCRLGVSTAGCIEKRDMVERIRGSGRYREGR